MKILYKPFGILFGLLAGFISQKLFNAVWGIFDKEEPPKATTEEAAWVKVIGAAAVQGLTFRVTRAAVDRLGAQGFRYFTGIWPGDKEQEKTRAAGAVGWAPRLRATRRCRGDEPSARDRRRERHDVAL